MAPQIDTAQRRAEAQELLLSLTSTHWTDSAKHDCRGDVDKLVKFAARIRRATLEAARRACKEWIIADVDGDWDEGYNRAIENIADALDRLREGVEGRPRCEQCKSLLLHEAHNPECLYLKHKPDAREGR